MDTLPWLAEIVSKKICVPVVMIFLNLSFFIQAKSFCYDLNFSAILKCSEFFLFVFIEADSRLYKENHNFLLHFMPIEYAVLFFVNP